MSTSVSDVHIRTQGGGLQALSVGRPASPFGDHLHVMDGDGASLCERVDAEDLVQVHGLGWRDVPISLRCRICRAMMQVYGAGVG